MSDTSKRWRAVMTNSAQDDDFFFTDPGQYTVGTSAECSIVIKDENLGERHCRIELDASDLARLLLTNLAYDGALVDGVEVGKDESCFLRHGSKVRAGNTDIYFFCD